MTTRLLHDRYRRDPLVTPLQGDFRATTFIPVDTPTTNHALTSFTLTADSTIHTKGAYTELIASTSGPVSAVQVGLSGVQANGTATGTLVDLAYGAAGAETVFLANINVGSAVTAQIPYYLPAGTRIAARCQALISADTVTATIRTFFAKNRTAVAIETIGALTASSKGTQFTMGTASEGTWVQLTAATAHRYNALALQVGTNNSGATATESMSIDIGVGAAASEVAVISNLFATLTNNETSSNGIGFADIIARPVDIPAGSRIAVRGQGTNGGNMDAVVFGLM